MNLRWTFSTLGTPEASLAEAAALARKFDFRGVEIRALLGRIDLHQLLKDEYENPMGFAAAVSAQNVPVVALDTSFRLLGGKEEDRRETVALARWADAAGVPYLRVFDGGDYRRDRNAEARRTILKELNWWEGIRRQEGVQCRLMMEPHWAMANAEDIVLLAESAGENLSILWDVGHTWNYSGRDPVEDWPRLKPFVCHIHVKDAVRDASMPDGMRDTLPGQGQLPLLELFQALEEDCFSGPVSLEWERYWNPSLPGLETAWRAGRDAGWWR